MTEENKSPFAVSIDPDAINKYMAEQLLKSSIGEQLKKEIDSAISSMSYRSPYKSMVEGYIYDSIRKFIDEEYKDKIREIVAKNINDEILDQVIEKGCKYALKIDYN